MDHLVLVAAPERIYHGDTEYTENHRGAIASKVFLPPVFSVPPWCICFFLPLARCIKLR
jgi:hypothetical protein